MITNGVVSIEDGTKASEEYAPARKVKVELTFAVPEGGDAKAFLDAAAAGADTKVNELLGRVKSVVKGNTAVESKVVESATKTTRKKTTEKTVAPIETSASGSDKAALEAAAGLKPAEVVVEPAEVVVEPDADNIDDLLGDAAPVPITDAELAKAAQTKNGQMKVKDPNFSVKIRALVVEYAGNPPKKITDVPVGKRQEFLDKLRDLT